ncbi:hypothetical protein IQ268_14695 [Oculatella sp. LEGE 06141]|uniref:hypothetical protein n=1 Tax=Oculatella sp. LEGE 06141 TaxID=1828648 RepID=UPI001882FAE7|nr:hypothetical protein [Oculatella sp. LEGE 06141]MBE9179816.1 hypothetical protein [Oculatella sp. LEGE 06141]
MAESPDLPRLKQLAKQQFGQQPGVLGVGIGERSLRIYVRSSDVCSQLPGEFEGVAIDCIVTGDITTQFG